MRENRRVAFGALIVLACTAPLATASPQQRVPDPTWSVPKPPQPFDVDPYETNNNFGPMYAPKGKLRSVVWYEGGWGRHYGEDPPDYNKRVAQRFDDSGRCIEIETWFMGDLESRTTYCSAKPGDPAHLLYWPDRNRRTARRDAILDASRRLVGLLAASVDADGSRPLGGAEQLTSECEYDPQGRLTQSTNFTPDGSVGSFIRWTYDAAGRISEVRYDSTRWTQKLEYDPQGRVIRAWTLTDNREPVERSEFAYDERGRLLISRQVIDADTTEFSEYTYCAQGKLIARQTLETSRSEFPDGDCLDETFDGIDRPLSSDLYDDRSRLRFSSRWTYEDDSRGNWIKKFSAGAHAAAVAEIWRKIEYAD